MTAFRAPLFALLALCACGSSGNNSQNPASGGSAAAGGSSASAGTGGQAGAGASGGTETGGAGGSAGNEPTIDSVVSESPSSASEHEPSVVVTPNGRVVLAWAVRNPGTFQIAYRVSDDGGATWGEITEIPLGPEQNVAANTSLTVAPDGTVYLAYGAETVNLSTGVRSNQGVYLATLAPGASKFEPSVELTDPSLAVGVYDQPFVAVTNAGMFVGYSKFAPDLYSDELVTRFSDDSGKSWSEAKLPKTGSQPFSNGVQLCRPRDGNRAYLNIVDSNLGIALWRSDDGGKTWPSQTQVILDEEYASLTFMRDGNCVADGDDVWVLYTLSDNASTSTHDLVARLTQLRLAHSGDGGKTFDSRIDVADAAVGPYYLLSRLAREDNGVLDVTYYAGSGEGDTSASYRHARSTDGGTSFAPSESLRKPVLYELKRTTKQFLGDYMGLTWQDGRLYSAFIDNSSASHVVFHAEDTP